MEVKGSNAYAIELSNVVTGSVIPNVVFPSSSNQTLVSTDGSVKWPSANDNIDGQTAILGGGMKERGEYCYNVFKETQNFILSKRRIWYIIHTNENWLTVVIT